MNRPVLDIVIVDYDAGILLRRCLESIAAHPGRFVRIGRVVVVDNASPEPSERWTKGLDLPILRIRNAENRGFAAGCNQGAEGSTAEYLLFLNPDTRLVDHSLDRPAAFMEAPENRAVGIAGIRLTDDAGNVSPSCLAFPCPSHYWNKALGLNRLSSARFPTGEIPCWDHGDTRRVDQVMGAFFFVRRPLFEALGGFDERFFVYFEEVDFSLRALRAGFGSVFLSEARAYHEGRGTTDKMKARRCFYSLRSRILYGYKNFGRLGGTSVLIVTLLVEPASRMVWAIARRAWREAAETIGASAMLWSTLPGTLRTAFHAGGTAGRP